MRARLPVSLGAALLGAACWLPPAGGHSAGAWVMPDTVVGPLPADLHVNLVDDTFEVHGLTAAQIRAGIRRGRPRLPGSDTVAAFTRWDIGWRYLFGPTPDGCALHDVVVSLTVVTTLPRWKPRPGARPEVVGAWRDYSRGLLLHERGHRAYAIQAAREVLASLRALRAPDCSGIDRIAESSGRQILEKYRRTEASYDSATDYGATQGARWPILEP